MSIRRRAAKRDANEKAIRTALEAVGATIVAVSEQDAPDLVVGFRGVNTWLEVKTDKGELKPGQADWHQWWRGQVAVVRTAEEALKAIGAI